MLWWTSRQLKADDWKVREAAAKKMGGLQDAQSVDALIDALKDTNARVRHAAAGALVRAGKPAVRPLAAALRSKHAHVRQAAASALVGIGNPAVPQLGSMLSDRDLTARETASAALGEIRTDEAMGELLSALDQGDSGTKEAAAAGLVRIGPRTTHPLITRLRDGTGRVRETAAAALVRIGRVAIDPLIASLKDNAIREGAIEVLWKIDPDWAQTAAAREAIPAVVETLRGDDERMRRTSATVLGQVGGVRAFEPLLAALADSDSGVQEAAASALGEIGDPRALVPLIAALNHGDSKARQAVSGAIVRIGHTIIQPLVEALKSKETSVREAAAAVLVRVGHSVVEPLVDALWKLDPEWSKTEDAKSAMPQFVSALKDAGGALSKNPMDVLRKVAEARVIKPLAATLKDMQDGLGKAGLSLGQIKNARDVESLARALDNSDAAVRKSASIALLEIGQGPEEPLVAALSSKNHVIRRAAAHALAERHDPRSREVLRCDLMDTSEIVLLDAAESLLKVDDAVMAKPLLKLLKQTISPAAEPSQHREHATARILRVLGDLVRTHAQKLDLDELEAISRFDGSDSVSFVPSTKSTVEDQPGADAHGLASKGTVGWSEIRDLARAELRRRRVKA